MSDSKERVKISIVIGDTFYTIVTSRQNAEEFISSWSETNGEKIITITGTLDHMDANSVEMNFIKEEIKIVQIVESKGLW